MNEPSRFLVCVANEGADDLQLLKVYRRLPDERAARDAHVRVIDDSGEDYLYPESYFEPLPLSTALDEKLASLVPVAARS